MVPGKQINVLGKSVSTPSIVVHIAEDEGIPQIVYPANYQKANNTANTKKIKGTRYVLLRLRENLYASESGFLNI